MRITERNIRRIIRDVLKEASSVKAPGDVDPGARSPESPSVDTSTTEEMGNVSEEDDHEEGIEEIDEADLDEECASAPETYEKAGSGAGHWHDSPSYEGTIRRAPRLTSCQIRRIIREELKLDIEKGDVILTGKFKNKRTVVKDFGTDDLGQPTINGMKALKFRIEKLMPKEKWSKKTQQEAEEAGLDEVRRVIRRELRK